MITPAWYVSCGRSAGRSAVRSPDVHEGALAAFKASRNRGPSQKSLANDPAICSVSDTIGNAGYGSLGRESEGPKAPSYPRSGRHASGSRIGRIQVGGLPPPSGHAPGSLL